MNRVPLIVTTLCRYQHFKSCIESLSNNKLASETDLYIGLDYPFKESHWEGYNKIKDYIHQGIKGFANVYYFEKNKNVGWYENFCSVRNQVYKEYDSFIYSEDDNVFSPFFLTFMNNCMIKYKYDNAVYAISGYSYPTMHGNFSGNVFPSKVYFSASGYGTWRDKEEKMYSNISLLNFKRMLEDKNYMYNLRGISKNQFCNFIRGMLQYKSELIKEDYVQKIDLAFGLRMLYENKVMIMPCKSLVRNCGYDGSGMNCDVIKCIDRNHINHRNYDYNKQPIDIESDWLKIACIEKTEIELANKLVENFFEISTKEFIKSYLSYIGISTLGLKVMKKLLKSL